MKIRAITVGVYVDISDFDDDGKVITAKMQECAKIIDHISTKLTSKLYEVQTTRIAFNPMEEWLGDDISDLSKITQKLSFLDNILQNLNISFCSLGGCSSTEYIDIMPDILSISTRFSSSVRFQKSPDKLIRTIAPPIEQCLSAARASLRLFNKCGNIGNFRFCASFNMTTTTPFFPAASYLRPINHTSDNRAREYSVSIGLENGDMLFLAFFAADTHDEGSQTLHKVMTQALHPIQVIVEDACQELSADDSAGMCVRYHGIDASINPGLPLPDSIGAGIEHMILPRPQVFGSYGTLPAISAITAAVKSLSPTIKLTGYSGLMLPVMEDIILSQRAREGSYGLRDLLVFSSLCGVGLDTVPVPGDITAETLASIYQETGALAYRLDKALSVRLLPMKGLVAGDTTNVDSPVLLNTVVFKV